MPRKSPEDSSIVAVTQHMDGGCRHQAELRQPFQTILYSARRNAVAVATRENQSLRSEPKVFIIDAGLHRRLAGTLRSLLPFLVLELCLGSIKVFSLRR